MALAQPGTAKWNPLIAFLTFMGESTILLGQSIRRLFRPRFEAAETINQMAFIGVLSVPIVALTTFFSGAVLALYSSDLLVKYGASNLAGGAIGLAATREIAPVLAGIMVAARCGSAMAAQIGSMAVTQQIDALRALSVNPIDYLVIPRLIGGVLMTPMLTLLGVYSAVIGGYVVSVSRGVAGGSFTQSMQVFVIPHDFTSGLMKALVFGLIVSIVACQQGLRTTEGAVGVGRATTNSVVISMVLIYVADYLLTAVLY